MQYQRLLPAVPLREPNPRLTIPGAFPLPAIERHPRKKGGSRSRSSSSSSSGITERARPIPAPTPNPKPHLNRMFCVYASDLQQNSALPLADTYKAGGDNRCPFCRTHIATRPGKAWEIVTDDYKGKEKHEKTERRTFLVKNRFVIKCHRESGGFACVLCATCKESDTVCNNIGALIDHLWREHTSDELERDDDIVEC
jgi:hypothetical protein